MTARIPGHRPPKRALPSEGGPAPAAPEVKAARSPAKMTARQPADRDVQERRPTAQKNNARGKLAAAGPAPTDAATSAIAARRLALDPAAAVASPYAALAARGAFEGFVATPSFGEVWVKIRPGTSPAEDAPVVTLGAVNASSETSADFEAALAQGGRTVISVLLPGQGETLARDLEQHGGRATVFDRELSARTQAKALLEVLDGLEVQAPVRAVGHGYGGMIAAEAKRRAPERFGEVLLIRPYVASSVQGNAVAKASHDLLAYNPFFPLGHLFSRPLAEAAHGVFLARAGAALKDNSYAHQRALSRLMQGVDQSKLVDSVRGLDGVSWLVVRGDDVSPEEVNALVYETTKKDGALDLAPASLGSKSDLVREAPELCARWVLARLAKEPLDAALETHQSTPELAERAHQVAQDEHAILDFFAELMESSSAGAAAIANAALETATLTRWARFPKDFDAPISQGGPGKGSALGGFGGIAGKSREENRRALQRTPVILIHGNGATGANPMTGMASIRDQLKKSGYNDAEVWAPSYLGPGGASDLSNAHVENVEDLRRFIDAVMDYLGVDKVDVVAHSLGATLARCWMKGLSKDGEKVAWREAPAYDKVGTFVSLCGANQGIHYTSEWAPSGPLMGELNREPTPHRAGARPLEDGHHVTYVSLWAEGDWVDLQNPGTGVLEGAELNRGFHLGYAMFGHLAALSSREVFDAFLPHLGKVPLSRRDTPDE